MVQNLLGRQPLLHISLKQVPQKILSLIRYASPLLEGGGEREREREKERGREREREREGGGGQGERERVNDKDLPSLSCHTLRS